MNLSLVHFLPFIHQIGFLSFPDTSLLASLGSLFSLGRFRRRNVYIAPP